MTNFTNYTSDVKSFCAENSTYLEQPDFSEDEDRRYLLTDEEAIAEEKRLDAYEAAQSSTSAELPPVLNGYETTVQMVDQQNLTANISFVRPLNMESDYTMSLDQTKTYGVLLNWGVFDNTTDTNPEYIFGAESFADVQFMRLLEPTSAVWLVMSAHFSLLLYYLI